MLIDTPTCNGGNINTEVLAKKCVAPKNRENICTLIKKFQNRDACRILLMKVNVFLTVLNEVNTKQKVDNTALLKQMGNKLCI